ncbi:MAG: hypothetical protein PHC41_05390 [Lachnospiraceae bacterium]|nr:hypothetical protein [Lachnospiraceae bacterium]
MKKKNKSFPVKSALLLGAAAVLLLGSTVGSTRAALTYYSANYSAQLNMLSIGVSLVENDKIVSARNYDEDGNEMVTSGDNQLLTNLIPEGEKFTPGKKYDEALSVQNTGSIDSFVRVILHKSWTDAKGNKDTSLSPKLIDLNFANSDVWDIDEDANTDEQTVLYYTNALPAGESTPDLSDTIRIDNEIARKVTKVPSEDGTSISYEYEYNGYTFHLDAEVDAVQTHNAAEAIKSAWGVDVTVNADETSMSLQ